MRTLALALALTVTGLAGCISGEPLDEGTTQAAAAAAEEAGAVTAETLLADADPNVSVAVVPVWSVGNAWTVKAFGAHDDTCVLAVTQDSGAYTLAPSCEAMAIYDAVFDVSWVGSIRADDLAGSQQGTPVRFFDFPLENGKTWTTTWDGLDITLTATAVASLTAPGAGAGPGFLIVGTTSEGVEYVKYDYSPIVKWWTGIEFVQEGYGISLQKFEENYKGTVFASSATRLLDHSPAVDGVFTPAGTFTVSEGQSALVVTFAGGAAGYGVVTNIVDPAGSLVYQRQDVAAEGGFFDVATLTATPGQYEISTVGTYAPSMGGFMLTVDEVLLEEIVLV